MRELNNSPISFGAQTDQADAYESGIDLNRELIRNPASTFFVRVVGNAMENDGLRDGDVVIVDRMREVKPNSLVVSVSHDEFTIRRVVQHGAGLALARGDGSVDRILQKRGVGWEIWGVITYSIHRHAGDGA